MKKIIKVLLITLIVFTLLACSKTNSELKLGVYISKDELASLTFGAGNTFILNRHIATSYDPSGNILILKFDKDETQMIRFKIHGNTLTFESGEIAETLIKKGTEFIFQEEK